MTQTHAKALTPWIVALMVPAMIVGLFAVVIALTPSATAHNLDWNWAPPRTASWVGTCGSNRRNLVFSVQGMMLAGHYYAEAGYSNTLQAQFDGVIGSATKNAIKKYQAAHGLSADGCVGPASWSSLRHDHGHMTGSYPNYLWNHGWGAEDVRFIRTAAGSPGKWVIDWASDNENPKCMAFMNSNNELCDHSGGTCYGQVANWIDCD